jgi:hypothetical protein
MYKWLLMKTKVYTAVLLLAFTGARAQAPQQFTEGSISYAVRIEQPGQPAKPVTGVFNLILKDKQYIKELQLSSGFRNVIIFNTAENKAFSLRQVQEKKYAIQLDAEELKKKQSCEPYTAEELSSDGRTIAGFSSQRRKVLCGKADPIILYYTRQWTMPAPDLFQYFPGFSYLPLSYDIRNEDGSLLHFELQKIEARPIDNGAFRIPADYKLISNEEYRQISR